MLFKNSLKLCAKKEEKRCIYFCFVYWPIYLLTEFMGVAAPVTSRKLNKQSIKYANKNKFNDFLFSLQILHFVLVV